MLLNCHLFSVTPVSLVAYFATVTVFWVTGRSHVWSQVVTVVTIIIIAVFVLLQN